MIDIYFEKAKKRLLDLLVYLEIFASAFDLYEKLKAYDLDQNSFSAIVGTLSEEEN